MRIRIINKHARIRKKTFVTKLILRGTAISLLFIAWMGPHRNENSDKITLNTERKDILFVLDLSQSMLCDDVKPNRLERAKLAIKSIAENEKGSHLGLQIFTNISYMQCPLTFDAIFFSKMLELAQPNYIQSQGTDFQPALKMALESLSKNEDLDNGSKAIVFISDGEDFGEEISPLIEELKRSQINMLCIGVGTEAGGKIEINGELKRDFQNNIVHSVLNKQALKKLAKMTNGKYFELSNSKNESLEIVQELNKIQGKIVKGSSQKAPRVSYYYIFALISLGLLLLDFLIKPKTLWIV